MNAWSIASRMMVVLLWLGTPGASWAQSAKSNGITVTISKLLIVNQNILLHFSVSNDTGGRVYIRDADGDEIQNALLGSGGQLGAPTITGLERCQGESAKACTTDLVSPEDINRYSYIEPGKFITVGFSYSASSAVSESDTISFQISLIARFVPQNGDPSQPRQPLIVDIPFNEIALSHQ